MDRTRSLPSQVPAGIETRLRQIGPGIEPALTGALYQPLNSASLTSALSSSATSAISQA